MDEKEAEIRSAIFQAIGEASMCWSETPKGIFESGLAEQVGERLYAKLLELEAIS